MSENIQFTDDEVSDLRKLLGLSEQATTPGSAVYLDEESAARAGELKDKIEREVNA